jgi:hypothetical protein
MKSTTTILILLCLCLVVSPASAGRLLLIPTADILGFTQISAQAVIIPNGNNRAAYWIDAGVFPRTEAELALFQGAGSGPAPVSAEYQLIPESTATAAFSLGVRDITNTTLGSGALYGGNAFYAVASKQIPTGDLLPLGVSDVRAHVGAGTGSLSGLFAGVEGKIPLGLHLAAEYDTHSVNVGAWFNIFSMVDLGVSSLHSDLYYSAVVRF